MGPATHRDELSHKPELSELPHRILHLEKLRAPAQGSAASSPSATDPHMAQPPGFLRTAFRPDNYSLVAEGCAVGTKFSLCDGRCLSV